MAASGVMNLNNIVQILGIFVVFSAQQTVVVGLTEGLLDHHDEQHSDLSHTSSSLSDNPCHFLQKSHHFSSIWSVWQMILYCHRKMKRKHSSSDEYVLAISKLLAKLETRSNNANLKSRKLLKLLYTPRNLSSHKTESSELSFNKSRLKRDIWPVQPANQAISESPVSYYNITKSLPNPVKASSKDFPNGTNITVPVTPRHFRNHRVRSNDVDARWALVCMGGLIFVLFAIILYTRMWTKRYTEWDYLYVSGEVTDDDINDGNVKFLSFKALIKAKTQFLADQLHRQADKFRKHRRLLNANRGKYTRLETIGENPSDNEIEMIPIS